MAEHQELATPESDPVAFEAMCLGKDKYQTENSADAFIREVHRDRHIHLNARDTGSVAASPATPAASVGPGISGNSRTTWKYEENTMGNANLAPLRR